MMKRHWILIGICIVLWVCLLPVVVLGEGSSTYIVLHANECLLGYKSGSYKLYFTSNSDVRFCLIKDYVHNSYSTVRAFVSTEPFSVGWWERTASNTNTCGTTYSNTASLYNGYYVLTSKNSANFDNLSDVAVPKNLPISSDVKADAIYYTYGDGSVGPSEPINWGILRDVEFQTSIAGQGLASKRNVDFLSWQNVNDANGNEISECFVEVQAVLGRFYANSASDLLEKTLNDFDIGSYNAVNLGTVPATQGTYSVSWQRVLDLAGWSFDSIYSHIEDSVFLKTGWYYQIRLVAPDGYIGSWQTLYTPLVSSAKASETVINQNSYSMDIYQVYEQITQINNQTSINVNFDGTEYTIQNPDDGTDPSEPYDYFDILKYILNGLIQIKGSIEKLPKLFMENVQSLITPPQTYDGSLAQQFDQAYESYMQENQPTIYDFLEGAEDLQPYINGLAPADQGIHSCIIHWDAVTLDLTMFNAGSVTFIQAGQHNLTETLLSFLHAFNLSYADYKLFVSAVIYLWLLAFIWRHFIRFLEKD